MAKTTIDSTARIADGAVIGAGVVIGPYCVVGPEAVIGPDCKLIAHVHVTSRTTLGAGCTVYPFASLGTLPQIVGIDDPPTRLEIGEGLIGQCASEKERILLTEVPADYVQISGRRRHARRRAGIFHELRPCRA